MVDRGVGHGVPDENGPPPRSPANPWAGNSGPA